jgi:tRNA U34 2-thiouridine synthase MnmA/TrmU
MDHNQKKVRALGLCSGGLDSRLAAVVLRNIGVEVEWITFETPFFSAEKAKQGATLLGIPLMVENITEIYLTMLKNPNCGYGKYMNPCLDCHALMFRLAGRHLAEKSFDFLFSGEVVGQRPMSQTKPSLRYVEKNSGYDGYILRPLSAKCLPETIPEKENLVDREKLLDISGRGRKKQIELAKELGVTDYPAPAGGCLLTDKGYSTRLKDYFDYQEVPTERELHLLKYGRHFRLLKGGKIIVGRTKADNDFLERYIDSSMDTVIRLHRHPGPLVLFVGDWDEPSVKLAASICVGYSKAPKNNAVPVEVTTQKGKQVIQVLGIPPEDVKKLLI